MPSGSDLISSEERPNFQASGKEQGDWFEDLSIRMLKAAGFRIDAVHEFFADAGVNIDIIAIATAEVSFLFTCKGSYQGARPGCERTDTLKKAIAEAYVLNQQGWGPVVLLTSHLPSTPSGKALLANVNPEVLYDAIELPSGGKRLNWFAKATELQLQEDLNRRIFTYALRSRRGRNRLAEGQVRPLFVS